MKKRVTGIGGIFFTSSDPKKSKEWYKKHLGFNTDDYGCTFWWKDNLGKEASTQWSPFESNTEYFKPSPKDFMINYRVENLEKLISILKEEGVTVVGEIAWILDNDENKIELWEPIDEKLK